MRTTAALLLVTVSAAAAMSLVQAEGGGRGASLPRDGGDALQGKGGAAKAPGDADAAEFVATQVFLIPHSHCDLGWLRTVDEYYEEYVRYSLDALVPALLENSNRTFNQVEIGFFSRWWAEQSAATKANVKKLVANGQLEFLNGGWVMADEAVTTFEGVVDQLTLGHDFLMRELGVRPRVAWHIDPFGASSTTPAMFADSGYDAFIINRIDYELKEAWQDDQKLQFVWRGTPSRGTSADMFTHVLDSHYSAPYGFDFEYFTPASPSDLSAMADTNPPIINTPPSKMTPSNLADRATALVADLQTRAAYFSTPHLLVPYGDDFKYVNPKLQYENAERLINYINDNVDTFKMRLRFATVSEYIAEVNKAGKTWPVVTEDFFPYAYAPAGARHDQAGWASANSYWSGFYTSRPQLKGQSRAFEGRVHAAELLLAAAGASSPPAAALLTNTSEMRRIKGLLKHHDAETGTSRPYVVEDYQERLDAGLAAADGVVASSTAALSSTMATGEADSTSSPSITTNGSALEAACSGRTVPVMLFNPLGHERTTVVSLPLACDNVSVTTVAPGTSQSDASSLVAVPAQVNPNNTAVFPMIFPAPHSADGTPPPRPPPKASNFTLYVQVTLPASGYTTIFVTGVGSGSRPAVAGSMAARGEVQHNVRPADVGNMTNGRIVLGFSASGELSSISDGTRTVAAAQSFEVYESESQWPQSDVYLLRPTSSEEKTPILQDTEMTAPVVTRTSGPLVEELSQLYVPKTNATAYVQHTLRLFKSAAGDSTSGAWAAVDGYVETELLAALPMWNRELVSVLRTDLATNVTAPKGSPAAGHQVPSVHTDANTQGVHQRVLLSPGWVDQVPFVDFQEPVAANYYPAVSAAFVRDEGAAAAAASGRDAMLGQVFDRSRGVAALSGGEMEVLLHRRCNVADQTLPLDDLTVISSLGALFVGGASDGSGAQLHRELARAVAHPVLPLFGPSTAAARQNIADGHIKQAALLLRNAPAGARRGLAGVASAAAEWLAKQAPSVAILAEPLPANVALQSLDLVDDGSVPPRALLRLRHLYAAGEHPTLSSPAQVNLSSLIDPSVARLGNVTETTLTGNADVHKTSRLEWVADPHAPTGSSAKAPATRVSDDGESISLGPLETRTFLVTLNGPGATLRRGASGA